MDTGTVEPNTRTVKRYVEIGSAITADGQMYIIVEAMITPIDCNISPKMWIIAALTLICSASTDYLSI